MLLELQVNAFNSGCDIVLAGKVSVSMEIIGKTVAKIEAAVSLFLFKINY